MDETIIGRTRELAAIDAILDRAPGAAAAVLLDGEPGMGKTTLWRAAVDRAAARGARVLTASPAGAEATFAYAALGDLLEPVDDRSLATLPVPQARALRVALLREEPDAGMSTPDTHAVAVALRNLLRALADASPVVVAVDDVQWLDTATAATLAFALRRLKDERVTFLLARRSGDTAGDGPTNDGPLDAAVVDRLVVGSLDPSAIGRLLAARLGHTLTHPAVLRIHAAAGGNPYYAVELAEAADRAARGGIETGAAASVPLPDSLRALLGARVAAIPVEARDALAVTAALARPTTVTVSAAVDTDAESALEVAIAARIVEVDDGRWRFTHPLLATAAWEAVSPARQRAIHGRLAMLVTDAEERARHLALADDRPDAGVAQALEAAAIDARARGAPAAGAELAGLARLRTPPEAVDDARRRGLLEAENLQLAGDASAARGRCEELLLTTAPHGQARAEVLGMLAVVLLQAYDLRDAASCLSEALAEAEDDRLRMRCEGVLTGTLDDLEEDVSEAIAHGLVELRYAERLDDAVHIATALRGIARNELRSSGRWPTAHIDRAIAGESAARAVRSVHEWPSVCLSDMEGWTDDLAGALDRLGALVGEARDRGEEPALTWLLVRAIGLEVVAGRWPDARRHVDECLELVGDAGHPLGQAVAIANRALVGAHAGDAAATRRDAAEATRLAAASSAAMADRTTAWALGLLELSLGDPAAAHRHLGPLVDHARTAGIREPGALRFVPDDIEGLIGAGLVDEARASLAWFDAVLDAADPRVHAAAAAARCRGLLLAASGDEEGALEALERSSISYATVAFPFGAARTLLALGAAQRRAGRRRDARETLTRAIDAFTDLGAAVWAEAAARELASISGRSAARDELSGAERRVAELVASGRTNREVASVLFLTERTVESHLSRVYAKLGVRSRTELAAAWASREVGGERSG